jgi:hypothetical protein
VERVGRGRGGRRDPRRPVVGSGSETREGGALGARMGEAKAREAGAN